jgi:XTP/dITP diphosphohydrolase
MKKIILATGNEGKVRELNAMLKDNYNVISQNDMQVKEVPETGTTFIENALIKARNASLQTQLPALADDSGLQVEALNGEPGVYSARYAGEHATDNDNIEKLILNMDQHDNRKAHFCCAMVFVKSASDPNPIIVERRWEGELLREPIGENGFGYDPIFLPLNKKTTFGQMKPSEKHKIDHRFKAFKKIKKFF